MNRILASAIFALALTGFSEPKINSVQPEKLTMSAKPQQVTVSGQDFREGLTLVVTTPGGQPKNYSGADIVGRGPSVFRVSIPFDAVGPYELVVMNTDGGKSSPFKIEVKGSAVAPTIDRIQPAEIARSQEAQLLTLRGTGFEPGLKLSVTDPTGSVTVKDAFDRLEPTIAVVRLVFEVSGTYALIVTNPTGGQSNSISITIR
jgi:hypothetical protein